MASLEEGEGPSRENSKRLKKDVQHQTNFEGDELRADSVILTDPDVLNCPICCDPLTTPVFQCENGHITCSICCPKLKNKCSFCRLPIGSIRCKVMEKALESAKVFCPNVKYGCKEKISYNNKYDIHKSRCQHELCSCPIPNCNYTGPSAQLYTHLTRKHKISSVQFLYNKVFHITFNVNEKFLILQEETHRILYILNLNNGTVPDLNFISANHAEHGESCLKFDILVKEECTWSPTELESFTLMSSGENEADAEDWPTPCGKLLPVPYFLAPNRQLKLDICIWGPGASPDDSLMQL